MFEQSLLVARIPHLSPTIKKAFMDLKHSHATLLIIPPLQGAVLHSLLAAYMTLDSSEQEEFLKGRYQDLYIIEDKGGKIKMEEAKRLIEFATLSSSQGKKIAIIENMERMTREAANAILKIIEEPHPSMVFIATTRNSELILPTLLSRMIVTSPPKISIQDILEELETLIPGAPLDDFDTASLGFLDILLTAAKEWKDSEKTPSIDRLTHLTALLTTSPWNENKTTFLQTLKEILDDKEPLFGVPLYVLVTYLIERYIEKELPNAKENHKLSETLRRFLESTYTWKADIEANANKKLASLHFVTSSQPVS